MGRDRHRCNNMLRRPAPERAIGWSIRALFTRRRRYLAAHRVVDAMLPLLYELAELFDAIAVVTDDERWDEARERFGNARAALHALSAAQERLMARAREVAHVDQMLANLHRWPDVVERLRERSRKPMARVLAAKIVRRR
jgi:hypothetical protein